MHGVEPLAHLAVERGGIAVALHGDALAQVDVVVHAVLAAQLHEALGAAQVLTPGRGPEALGEIGGLGGQPHGRRKDHARRDHRRCTQKSRHTILQVQSFPPV